LGAISYSLYLVHIPIGGRVINFGKRFLDSSSGHLLLSIAATVASIAAAYLLYRFVEKPAQSWASKVSFDVFNRPASSSAEIVK
jgi:peptidoglycan/LPS O-acetylase OafA/YrhL